MSEPPKESAAGSKRRSLRVLGALGVAALVVTRLVIAYAESGLRGPLLSLIGLFIGLSVAAASLRGSLPEGCKDRRWRRFETFWALGGFGFPRRVRRNLYNRGVEDLRLDLGELLEEIERGNHGANAVHWGIACMAFRTAQLWLGCRWQAVPVPVLKRLAQLAGIYWLIIKFGGK